MCVVLLHPGSSTIRIGNPSSCTPASSSSTSCTTNTLFNWLRFPESLLETTDSSASRSCSWVCSFRSSARPSTVLVGLLHVLVSAAVLALWPGRLAMLFGSSALSSAFRVHFVVLSCPLSIASRERHSRQLAVPCFPPHAAPRAARGPLLLHRLRALRVEVVGFQSCGSRFGL